jgi:MFS family permease
MPKTRNTEANSNRYRELIYQFFDIVKGEKRFIALVAVLFLIAGIIYPYTPIAMWFGFLLAAYSAVSNDSIQTIGTFIASNADRKWYVLWLYIAGIFLLTVTIGWVINEGDVTYGRLQARDDSGKLAFPQPESFAFLQIAAPIFLLVLTRLRMPVSTTFLLLSSFAVSSGAVGSVITKSISAYLLAFALGLTVWLLISRLTARKFKGKPVKGWVVAQWITSGSLWSVWIMQDAANIAIYLPRTLDFVQFLGFAAVVFFGLGLIFFLRGDKIQEIVNEKSEVRDIRSATIIDFVYAVILIYKLTISVIPMSTTWVFIGLLGGRELGIRLREQGKGKTRNRRIREAFRMIGRDLALAMIGLIVSVVIATSVNPDFREELVKLFE